MSKIKPNDTVFVRSGKYRTKSGPVERVDQRRGLVWVTGINIVKRHAKKSAQTPQGGIIEKLAPLPAGKVMLVDAKTKRPTRVGWQGTGKDKQRVAKRSGETVTKEENKK